MAAKQSLERLNYFNGQRLEAVDYRVEQAYHIAVRRELNLALYTPGIAKGLEVTKKSAHTVLISPGLALDYWGREIILPEALELTVGGMVSTTPGEVFGNYLVIEYSEERSSPVHEQCAAKSGGNTALTWGGPTRIVAKPLIYVQDSWPSETSGKLVLAQIELKQGCEVAKVHTGMRKYVAASKPPKVRPLGLEGEKDIDTNNPKVFYFQVDGGYPDAVLLYLRAARFSTLYYSEIGSHSHILDIQLQEQLAIAPHKHPLGKLTTNEVPAHTHTVEADVQDPGSNGVELGDQNGRNNLTTGVNMVLSMEGKHFHEIAAGESTQDSGGLPAHNHAVIKKAASDFGALPKARPGPALGYVDDLRIVFDGSQDVTAIVLAYLQGRPGQAGNWVKLGDGTSTHTLVTQGTGPIDILQLGLDLSPGDHSLTFKINKGGGQIHYNLYVE